MKSGAGNGILWHGYEATIALLKERKRPVLLFVLDADGVQLPFLRELLSELPRNERLRALLDGPCAALLLKTGAVPELLQDLGAGSLFHVAILSPAGLTPMAVFDHVTGQPRELAEEIALALDAASKAWA